MPGRSRTRLAVVEDCLFLDIRDLRPLLSDESIAAMTIEWKYEPTGRHFATARIARLTTRAPKAVAVSLTIAGADADIAAEATVELVETRPYFGGTRQWLVCPTVIEGARCNKPCGRLYVPSGSTRLACRDCHHLVYESSRASHRYDRMFTSLAGYLPGHSAASLRALVESRLRALAHEDRRHRPT